MHWKKHGFCRILCATMKTADLIPIENDATFNWMFASTRRSMYTFARRPTYWCTNDLNFVSGSESHGIPESIVIHPVMLLLCVVCVITCNNTDFWTCKIRGWNIWTANENVGGPERNPPIYDPLKVFQLWNVFSKMNIWKIIEFFIPTKSAEYSSFFLPILNHTYPTTTNFWKFRN